MLKNVILSNILQKTQHQSVLTEEYETYSVFYLITIRVQLQTSTETSYLFILKNQIWTTDINISHM